MPTTGLHVRYRRSGGFAGLDLVAQAPAEELSQEQAGIAADLLSTRPAPAAAGAAGAPSPGMPDQFSYELHLDDGTHRRTYHWAEHEVPESVRPLLAELNHRATPA